MFQNNDVSLLKILEGYFCLTKLILVHDKHKHINTILAPKCGSLFPIRFEKF